MFLSILNQMKLYLVQNQNENCHHDHIPLKLEGNVNLFLRIKEKISWKISDWI